MSEAWEGAQVDDTGVGDGVGVGGGMQSIGVGATSAARGGTGGAPYRRVVGEGTLALVDAVAGLGHADGGHVGHQEFAHVPRGHLRLPARPEERRPLHAWPRPGHSVAAAA